MPSSSLIADADGDINSTRSALDIRQVYDTLKELHDKKRDLELSLILNNLAGVSKTITDHDLTALNKAGDCSELLLDILKDALTRPRVNGVRSVLVALLCLFRCQLITRKQR